MKVLAKSLLVFAASLGWACGQAHAQNAPQGPSTLLPLPAVTPLGVMTTSYNEHSNAGLYGGSTTAAPQAAYPAYGSAYGASYAQQPAPSVIPSPTAPSVIEQSPVTGATEFEDAVHDGLGGCGECGGCSPACCCRGGWFGAVGGMIMGRSRPNVYWTTHQTGVNENQLMNTGNAQSNWGGGPMITGGFMSCDCCGNLGPGWGVTYWGIYGMNGSSQLVSPTNELSTPMDLGFVSIGGTPAELYFDNASEHRIVREDNITNIELNAFLPIYVTPRAQVIGLAGFRYFRFDEYLSFGSSRNGTVFSPTSADTAFLDFGTINNMYGGQIGFIANWMIGQRWGVFAGPKVGVFMNEMSVHTQLYNGAGDKTFDLYGTKNDYAMLCELDAGVSYFWRPNLFTWVGYKMVGISNIANGDDQFLPFLNAQQDYEQVKGSGSLILYGATFGAGFLF